MNTSQCLGCGGWDIGIERQYNHLKGQFCNTQCQTRFHIEMWIPLERGRSSGRSRSRSRSRSHSKAKLFGGGKSNSKSRSRSRVKGLFGKARSGSKSSSRSKSPIKKLFNRSRSGSSGSKSRSRSPIKKLFSRPGSKGSGSKSRSRSPIKNFFNRSRSGSSGSKSRSKSPLKKLLRRGHSSSSSQSRSRSPLKRLFGRGKGGSRSSSHSRSQSRSQSPMPARGDYSSSPGYRGGPDFWRRGQFGFGYGLWWAWRYPAIVSLLPYDEWYPTGEWVPYYTVDAAYVTAYTDHGTPIPPDAYVMSAEFGEELPALPTFDSLGISPQALSTGDASARDTISAELANLRTQYADQESRGFRVVPDLDRGQFSWVKMV